MSQENIPVPVGPRGVELRDLDSMFRFAQCYLQSGLAPASFKNAQQLVIAWAKAAELGLSPLQAIEGMAIINNRVGLMGDLALAMVEASGLLEDKEVEYEGSGDELVCTVRLTRKGRKSHDYTFSVREAIDAGIYQRNQTWKAYPRRMTYYRALGFGLRDEFSDVLKGTKTVEELADYPDATEKIRFNQERDAEIIKHPPPGAQIVETKGARPSPEEALEPAFAEEVEKQPPPFVHQLNKDFPPTAQPPSLYDPPSAPKKTQTRSKPPAAVASSAAPEPPDDLDMGEPSQEQGPPAPQESQPASRQPAAAEPVEPPWKEHVILGVAHNRFHKRKVGDLKAADLAIIEHQWLPAVREQWDQATDEQRADATAFEAAIAYNKMVKPW